MLSDTVDNETSSAAPEDNPLEALELNKTQECGNSSSALEEKLQVNENLELEASNSSESDRKSVVKCFGELMKMISKGGRSDKKVLTQTKSFVEFIVEKTNALSKIAKDRSRNPAETIKPIEEFVGKLVGDGANNFVHEMIEKMGSDMIGFELCKREKNELQKKFHEVEKKLKETQDEMKRYKKISMEVIEKKKEEIQKLENGESLIRKDEENEKMKIGHQKILQEKNQILEDVKNEMKNLEENLEMMKQEKEKIHVAHSKLIIKKEEELERLLEEKNLLERKATKSDNLEKQLKEIQREVTKKNEEVEKLKQGNLKLIKGKEEELEKMRKHQTQEIKEKKKEVDHLKVDNLQLSNLNNDLILRINRKEEEDAQLKEENKKLVDKIRTLEQNMARLEKFAKLDQLKIAIRLNKSEFESLEKNQFISEFPDKISPNLTSHEPHKDKKKFCKMSKLAQLTSPVARIHSGEFHTKPIQLQNKLTSSRFSKVSPRLQMPSEVGNKFGYTLDDLQYKRDTSNVDSLLKQASEMKDRIISMTDAPKIREIAENEYQQYEKRLREYQRAIEMNIQLLEGSENVGFAIPIPDFPTLSSHFTAECYLAVHEQDKEYLTHNFN